MITSDLQDRVSAIADDRLPAHWGAEVKVKTCRHGFRVRLHVNNPEGLEVSADLRIGSLKTDDYKIALTFDSLIEKLWDK